MPNGDMKLHQLLNQATRAKNVLTVMLQHPNERVREAFLLVCEEQSCDVASLVRAINRYPENG